MREKRIILAAAAILVLVDIFAVSPVSPFGTTVAAFGLGRPIKAGDKIPWSDLHFGFPPQMVNVPMHVAGRSVVIVGLPGAFTPSSSAVVSSYLENQDHLNALGVEEIIVCCVHDGAVMRAWGNDCKVEGSMITFFGDPSADLVGACGMMMSSSENEEASNAGFFGRCNAFILHVVNCVVEHVGVGELDVLAPVVIDTISEKQDLQIERPGRRSREWAL